MNWAPRIRLQSLFLLFFCAAVGLATYPDPVGAIQPAIATAMVIGLVQQSRQLVRFRSEKFESNDDLVFARRYSIVWRLVLTAIIATTLTIQMLFTRGLVEHFDNDEFLIIDPFSEAIVPFCVLLVLCNSLYRWRSASPNRSSIHWRPAFKWLFAALLTLIMVVEGTTIEFLVHRAVSGMHVAIPVQFRRPQIYPNLANEAYRPLWLALGSALSLAAFVTTAVPSIRKPVIAPGKASITLLRYGLFILPPLLFCYWYYAQEFHRLSPDIAGAGLALSAVDSLSGAVIVVMLLTAGAYRLSRDDAGQATVIDNLVREGNYEVLHESVPCLLLLTLNAIGSLVSYVTEMHQYLPMFGPVTFGKCLSWACYPTTLLMLANVIAVTQFAWIRWSTRHQKVPWKLTALRRTKFYQSWIMLAVLLAVGIPTLRAFAFLLWLGPINLLPFFGLQ